jgi:hypothetical protein
MSLMEMIDGAIPNGLTRDDCLTIAKILRQRPDPAEAVDLKPEMDAITDLQERMNAAMRQAFSDDPRTAEQRDLDIWQKEVSDTRNTDYPY